MYSYEDRIRAVELYIKVGKRIGVTIRQLGYPTKNSLKSWYAEYERCLDLARGYKTSTSKYSLAQREKAVEYYLEHGRSIAATATALATRHGIRCVPGFTNCTPSCIRVSLADLTVWPARQR